MSLAIANAARLKPEVRLAQTVSSFEASLSPAQKKSLVQSRLRTLATPLETADVMQLTAEVDRVSRPGRVRCFGPRLTNFLQSVQQFASLGDVVIGGSQNIIACGVWSVVRLSLLSVVNYSTFLEKISLLLMAAGTSAPRYQAMALLYPKSQRLQDGLSEYFIIVVSLCHQILKFTQKTTVVQVLSTLPGGEIQTFQSELEKSANAIKEEVNFLMARQVVEETDRQSRFRSIWKDESHLKSQLKAHRARLRILDSCSTYNYKTTWKQTRKLGRTTRFQQQPSYTAWKHTVGSQSLIYSAPLGSGKSVLMANIVDDLHLNRPQASPVCLFFCRHDIAESLTAATMMGSLTRQLLETVKNLSAVEETERQASATALRLHDTDSLLQLVDSNLPQDSSAFFVIDGLDECERREVDLLLEWISTLQNRIHLRICIAVRTEPGTQTKINSRYLMHSTQVPIPDNTLDIEEFVTTELQDRIRSDKLVLGDPTLVLAIQHALVGRAKGMFLWVVLQIESLCSETTDAGIRAVLDDLPKDLSETFSRILAKTTRPDDQRRILEFVLAAERPLTTDEMRELFSVVPGNTTWDPSRLPNDVDATLSCCGSLIVVDEEEHTVRSIHHSFTEFLSREHFPGRSAYTEMANCVFTYLSYNIFETQIVSQEVPTVQAARVISTVMNSMPSSSAKELALKLLRPPKTTKKHDLRKVLAETYNQRRPLSSDTYSLYSYAKEYCWRHSLDLDKFTLLKGAVQKQYLDLEATDGCGRNLLFLAFYHGNAHLVRELLALGTDFGADFNRALAVDGVDFNLLDLHATWEDTSMAHKLLGVGVDIDRSRADGLTPLMTAVGEQNISGVHLLLSAGADVDQTNDQGYTPLMRAVEVSLNAVAVKILLDAKASVNHENINGNTALVEACSRGNMTAVELLVDKGADVNQVLQHGEYGNPLVVACRLGKMEVVEFLVDNGGDVKQVLQHGLFGNALVAACAGGHIKVVQFLVDNGADVKQVLEHRQYGNSLVAACRWGKTEVVEFLMDNGVDVKQVLQHGLFGNALVAACAGGHMNVVQFLVDKGANGVS